MNSKFKDIAEQAGFVLWGDESWNIGDVVDWNCRYDDELVKFAELIVKECIMLCEEWIEIDKDFKQDKANVGIDPEIGPGFCIDSIKNHFGVK